MARSGVIPIPPAISSDLSRRRAAPVKTPNGPSASTRVPGLIAANRALWSPSALTVIRSERPSGAKQSPFTCVSSSVTPRTAPVSASHTRTVWSSAAEAR